MTTTPASLGLLLLRLVLGVTFAAHGYQKFFVDGLNATAEGFAGMGIPLPGVAAPAVAGLELVGGAALVLGLATRVVAALLAADMLVALALVHLPAGFFAAEGGVELVLLLAAGAAALTFTGPGRVALDALAARRLPSRRRERAAGYRPARA